MPDDSRAQDPDELAADGDAVLEGVRPPTDEEREAAQAAEMVRVIEGHDNADR